MNHLLPTFGSDQEYDDCKHAEETYLPAMREICGRHAISYRNITKFQEGESAIVFAIDDDLVIKLCPPLSWSEQMTLETTVLNHIQGNLPTPTPQVVDVGNLEDWPYFIMTHLSGQRLNKVFPTLAERDQLELYTQMGATIRELHSMPGIQVNLPVPKWNDFVYQRSAACQAHQRSGGVSESLVEQIPSFLEAYLPGCESSSCSAILHTELSLSEWFVGQENGAWRLTGIFDFGDVLIGDPKADCLWREFDLCRLRSYFSGYGYSGGCVSETLACTMFAYVMIHRYATLSWLFQPSPALLKSAESLEAIALALFPIHEG